MTAGRRTRGPRAEGDRGPRSLTASEAAALIGVSVATIRGWADQGSLPSHRTVGNHRRFELDELREWLADRGAAPPEAGRLRVAPREIPPCPQLARELNARTEAIVGRVLEGYDARVPTPLTAPSGPSMRRLTIRFLRILASGLETRDARPPRPAGPSSRGPARRSPGAVGRPGPPRPHAHRGGRADGGGERTSGRRADGGRSRSPLSTP